MTQRLEEDLTNAVYRAMPQASLAQKQTVALAVRAVAVKHFAKLCLEAAELDAMIDRQAAELQTARAQGFGL
jgi:hypothetical protein